MVLPEIDKRAEGEATVEALRNKRRREAFLSLSSQVQLPFKEKKAAKNSRLHAVIAMCASERASECELLSVHCGAYKRREGLPHDAREGKLPSAMIIKRLVNLLCLDSDIAASRLRAREPGLIESESECESAIKVLFCFKGNYFCRLGGAFGAAGELRDSDWGTRYGGSLI